MRTLRRHHLDPRSPILNRLGRVKQNVFAKTWSYQLRAQWDAARFGMLVRDRGKFSGEQVVPAAWVESALGGNGLRATLFASVAGSLKRCITLEPSG